MKLVLLVFASITLLAQSKAAIGITLQGFTKAQLDAYTPVANTIGVQTDSSSSSCSGTVTGGGSTKCTVLYNGSAWVYASSSGGVTTFSLGPSGALLNSGTATDPVIDIDPAIVANKTGAETISGLRNFSSWAFSTQTDAATITWAIGSSSVGNATVTLGGNRTLNLTGMVNGGSYVLRVVQDGGGSKGLTLGTGCTWKVSGGGAGAITPSTTAGAIDVLAWVYDGTNCYANFNKNFN